MQVAVARDRDSGGRSRPLPLGEDQPASLAQQQACEVAGRIEVALRCSRADHRLPVGVLEVAELAHLHLATGDEPCLPAAPLVAPDLLPETLAHATVALRHVDVGPDRPAGQTGPLADSIADEDADQAGVGPIDRGGVRRLLGRAIRAGIAVRRDCVEPAGPLDAKGVALGRLLVRDDETALVDALDGGDADRQRRFELVRPDGIETLTTRRGPREHGGVSEERPHAVPGRVEVM